MHVGAGVFDVQCTATPARLPRDSGQEEAGRRDHRGAGVLHHAVELKLCFKVLTSGHRSGRVALSVGV